MLGLLLVAFNRKLVKWKRHQKFETHSRQQEIRKKGQSPYSEREGNAGCWEFKIMSKENNYFI